MKSLRKQYLDEMGLSPQWVLRSASPAQGCPAESPQQSQEQIIAPPVGEVAKPVEKQPSLSGDIDVSSMDWEALEECIRQCTACGLCTGRKQAVPGVGDRQAAWLFIGEGPGAEEDAQGEPFVGQAGRLLDAMLLSISLERGKDVYIANAVKCRPPGNRTPAPEEIAQCLPYLQRQISMIRPRLIVLLGRTAVQAVLKEEKSLSSLRGKPHVYRQLDMEIPVVVTYHPAYLLRNLPDKTKVWEDLCLARQLMHAMQP